MTAVLVPPIPEQQAGDREVCKSAERSVAVRQQVSPREIIEVPSLIAAQPHTDPRHRRHDRYGGTADSQRRRFTGADQQAGHHAGKAKSEQDRQLEKKHDVLRLRKPEHHGCLCQ